MTTTQLPVWLSATFAESGDYHVSLRISANNDPTLEISVIHDAVAGLASYDLNGNSSVDLVIQDNEALTIIVRDQGIIIASGVFAVSVELIGTLSAVLVPVTMHNLLIDQAERRIFERATHRALAAVHTGELANGEVH